MKISKIWSLTATECTSIQTPARSIDRHNELDTPNITERAHLSERTYPAWMIWKRRRYVVAIMAFFGFFNIYALRVNLSVGIVAMTTKTEVKLENETVTHVRKNRHTQILATTEYRTVTNIKKFDWDSRVQGYVHSSFFYSYILTQVPGGWLAARFGGKYVYGIGVAVTGALTVISPFAAKHSYYSLIAVRVMGGIFEGVTYPSMHAVWAEWAPLLERSRLVAIGFSGCYVGTLVATPLSAILADRFGWESMFYVFGCVAILWFVAWCIIVSDSPSRDPTLSNSELKYIQESLGEQQVSRIAKHPWRRIFTSVPVWSIIVAHFSENWGNYTLLTQLPMYMRDARHLQLTSTGIMSAIPYLTASIITPTAGHVADWLLKKQIFNVTQVRKIFTCGAYVGQAVFMIMAVYILTPTGSITCVSIASALGGLMWAGSGVNHLDIAPQHASVLMGISNTFASIPEIVSPILTGYIVPTASAHEWQTVFAISSCVYLFGATFYGIFGSGELQPWAINVEANAMDQEHDERKHEQNLAQTSG
ncbi:hypothetical protein PPYR_08488 [Photinus pyralis]|uniref:Sialin n=1 Tax=Photinus pyralis TaxID=7054 RepID=A0A5N4AJG8_PHOPY|nr:sialin-like isoform X1 [Photinus pyralis]XP_031345894.1 sialin-like isoform X1 [Photinus pyralis]KAB0797495.1 hypothetical protein PPYR_08488 [Photinus pyralis]